MPHLRCVGAHARFTEACTAAPLFIGAPTPLTCGGEAGAHREALAVLGLVGDVDEEGHDGGVAPHQAHDRVQRQVRALHDHALAPALACAYEPVQALQHHLALRLVALRRTYPRDCVVHGGGKRLDCMGRHG